MANNQNLVRGEEDLETWEEADLYATENLQGEELAFFYRTTD